MGCQVARTNMLHRTAGTLGIAHQGVLVTLAGIGDLNVARLTHFPVLGLTALCLRCGMNSGIHITVRQFTSRTDGCGLAVGCSAAVIHLGVVDDLDVVVYTAVSSSAASSVMV